MVVTVVLRLLAEPLESGELVGHVEHVATGASEPVRGFADIVAFCRHAAEPALPALEVEAAPSLIALPEPGIA
jgi:hypothetical protein